MLNLNELSSENLNRIQKVLKITLDYLELRGVNKLWDNSLKVPLEKFPEEKLCYDDIIAVFNYVNKEEKIVWIENKYLKKKIKDRRIENSIEGKDIERWNEDLLENLGISEKDLKNYIILKIKNLNRLKEILNEVEAIIEKKKPVEELSKAYDKTNRYYDPKDNSLLFYSKLYKPRKGPQARVIRYLIMKHQEENNNGTVLKEGERISENMLASEVGLTLKQFKSIKKQFNRTFNDKGFPLKIDTNSEGVLLILTK